MDGSLIQTGLSGNKAEVPQYQSLLTAALAVVLGSGLRKPIDGRMKEALEKAESRFRELGTVLDGSPLELHAFVESCREDKAKLVADLAPLSAFAKNRLKGLHVALHQAPKVFDALAACPNLVLTGWGTPCAAHNLIFPQGVLESELLREFIDGRWRRERLQKMLTANPPSEEEDIVALGSSLKALGDLGVNRSLVKIDPLEEGFADLRVPRSLIEAVHEYIDNAVYEVINQAGGHVSIHCSCSEFELVIAIRDNGPGLPENVQEAWGKYELTNKVFGTGKGLLSNLNIVNDLNGWVDVLTRLSPEHAFRIGRNGVESTNGGPLNWHGTLITVNVPLAALGH